MARFQNLLLAATAGGLALAGCGPSRPPDGPPAQSEPPVAVSLLTIQWTTQPKVYEAAGAVRAELNAVLSSKVMGRVTGVFAREGDSVSNGQILLRLDSTELAAGVRQAHANLNASQVGVDSALTAKRMESQTSAARIAQSEAALDQSKAALLAAQSKLDLVLAGPRTQERTQARLAVAQAESNLLLAKSELERMTRLEAAGAVARRLLEQAQTAYDLALAQRDTAKQAEEIALEGSREEEIRAAREGVAQARAAVKQAEANLKQARASALENEVRDQDVRAAKAQVVQSSAALSSARASLGYATVAAPFDGRVVQRSADPGAMALPGSPLLSIEGGNLRLEVSIPESLLRFVKKGESVRVAIDAVDRTLMAAVDEIAPQGDLQSRSFVVKLLLKDSSGVRSSMFGRAFIETEQERVLLVPASAVWEREGLHYVYVVNEEGLARLRIVTVGAEYDGKFTVLTGLAPGERIVAGGRESVRDGMKVASR